MFSWKKSKNVQKKKNHFFFYGIEGNFKKKEKENRKGENDF